MAITRLKRKEKRNKIVAKKRVANIKMLTKVPVIRKVDIEELKKKASPGLATKVKEEVKKVVDKVAGKE
ncbi:MAG: hypothetical protein ACJ75J_04935 [Cytophagaceae bacterium]